VAASTKPGFALPKKPLSPGSRLLQSSCMSAFPSNLPLFAALLIGGLPMVWQLLKKLFKREFGSDLLAGISILTAILLAEYLVAAIVVLVLSGGEALEEYATARASSVLDAVAACPA